MCGDMGGRGIDPAKTCAPSCGGPDGGTPIPALRKSLGLCEAVALSLSIVAPTMAMAFNVALAAGAAAPLAFAIGTAVLAIVGLSFVAFAASPMPARPMPTSPWNSVRASAFSPAGR